MVGDIHNLEVAVGRGRIRTCCLRPRWNARGNSFREGHIIGLGITRNLGKTSTEDGDRNVVTLNVRMVRNIHD